jgi:hypothetical protein
LTPFWRRVRAAEEAAAKALSATTPEGWSKPAAAILVIWLGAGAAQITAMADDRRGHGGKIRVRAALAGGRLMTIRADAATVEADLRVAFAWAMDNLRSNDAKQ